MSPPPDRLLVGVFGAPHGVRGDVRLKSFTQDPAAIAGYALSDATGHAIKLTAARVLKDDLLIARVEGVETRDQAALLANQRLFMRRRDLPVADDEDEFYHADLIGLAVEIASGEPLGRVTAVLDFGAGDLLEITPDGGGQALLLPFTRAVVPVVDLAAGRVIVSPPAEREARPEGEP